MNCHPDLSWDLKAAHLTKFGYQMLISGYSESYRQQVIQGAYQRYTQVLREHNSDKKPMYRTREQMIVSRQSQTGNSNASWFLRGQTRQVLQVPATPQSQLAKNIQEKLGDFRGPDLGTTKVIERAGKRITSGLARDDPFPKLSCPYEEPCLVGPGCNRVSSCYEIACDSCAPDPLRPSDPPTQPIAGARRSRYVGQSGTTLHRRQKSHRDAKESVMKKHENEYHPEGPPPTFRMVPLNNSRTLLNRLVWESQHILEYENQHPRILMNSKGEWGANKMVRFTAQARRV